VLVGVGNEKSDLHSLDDLFVLDVVIYLAFRCRHASVGTLHVPNIRNCWRIFSRTVLVENCVHPASSLVL
jgi:hypothetical protein